MTINAIHNVCLGHKADIVELVKRQKGDERRTSKMAGYTGTMLAWAASRRRHSML